MSYEAQIYETITINHVVNGAEVTNGSFSTTSDIDNPIDNTTNKYLYAKATFVLYDLSAAPSAGLTVDLYRRGLEVKGSLNEPEPDANYKGTFVGSFLIDAADPGGTEVPYVLMGIPLLPNKMSFYIQNNLGVTISANWDLDITPYTFRPITT
jgi:hypothetical protein